jgi:hypothetical protein
MRAPPGRYLLRRVADIRPRGHLILVAFRGREGYLWGLGRGLCYFVLGKRMSYKNYRGGTLYFVLKVEDVTRV